MLGMHVKYYVIRTVKPGNILFTSVVGCRLNTTIGCTHLIKLTYRILIVNVSSKFLITFYQERGIYPLLATNIFPQLWYESLLD